MDPLVEAALTVAKEGHQALREVIGRADAQALDWRPGRDTNSICVLVNHAMNGEKVWLSRVVGDDYQRDREAEFRLSGHTAADLLRRIDQADADVTAYLSRLKSDDLNRQIEYAGRQVSGAWALIHALEHVREHVGQGGLTLQLWEQQQKSAR